MSEILKIAPNGQWTLEKAISTAKNVYDMKNKPYTESDAKAAQIYVVKHGLNHPELKNQNSFKNIKMPDGSEKLHVLMHRGISNYLTPEEANKEYNRYSNKPTDRTFNMLKLNDKDVEHSGDAVHTMSYKDALQYGGSPDKVHSFWVPIDNINAHAHYIAGGWKNPNRDNDARAAIDQNKFHGQDDVANLSNKDFESVRSQGLDNDPRHKSPHDRHHVSVKPGKYIKASKEEIANLFKK